jgi:hypothetical protein
MKEETAKTRRRAFDLGSSAVQQIRVIGSFSL